MKRLGFVLMALGVAVAAASFAPFVLARVLRGETDGYAATPEALLWPAAAVGLLTVIVGLVLTVAGALRGASTKAPS